MWFNAKTDPNLLQKHIDYCCFFCCFYIYIYRYIYIYKPDILPHTKAGFPKRDLQEVVWGAPGHMRLSTTRCWVKLKAINGKKKKKRKKAIGYRF